MSVTQVGAWRTSDGKLHESVAKAEEWEALGPLDGLRGATIASYKFEHGAVCLVLCGEDQDDDRKVWFRAAMNAGVPKLIVNRG